jgi:hypothetical protein
MRVRYLIALSAFALAACAKEPTGARGAATTPQAEATLATSFASYADSTAERNGAPMPNLIDAFFRELRAHPNAQAQALVDKSRALADSGRAARDAGDMDTARRYFMAAHETLFDAVVIVLPNAYERTGAVVDTILARITERLGDRDAPRIRRALGVITQVRADAQAAAASDEGHALALNMRALDMLRRLREHLQHPGGPGLPGDQGQGPPPGGQP